MLLCRGFASINHHAKVHEVRKVGKECISLLLLLLLNEYALNSTATRPKVFFDVSIGGGPAQRIEFTLFNDVVPKV